MTEWERYHAMALGFFLSEPSTARRMNSWYEMPSCFAQDKLGMTTLKKRHEMARLQMQRQRRWIPDQSLSLTFLIEDRE